MMVSVLIVRNLLFRGSFFVHFLWFLGGGGILVFGVEGGVGDAGLGGTDDGGEVVEAR